MKNMKNKILILFSSCAFVALMLFNVSVSSNTGMVTDISLSGMMALAATSSEGLSCNNLSNCNDGASCSGPGQMLGPCSIKCDLGPSIDCGIN